MNTTHRALERIIVTSTLLFVFINHVHTDVIRNNRRFLVACTIFTYYPEFCDMADISKACTRLYLLIHTASTVVARKANVLRYMSNYNAPL